jgi:uncharacterized membrane protein YcaP (DUF421 family)
VGALGDLFKLSVPWWALALRSVGVYVILLAGLRIFGKREVGQFTLFDLVFILLVANAVQPAMTGPDSSFLGGVIIIVSLLVANVIVGRLDDIPFFHRLLWPHPAVLVKDGAVAEDVMHKEGVTRDELEMAMREHGVEKVTQVTLAELEADGTISIISKDGKQSRHRRRRFRSLRR